MRFQDIFNACEKEVEIRDSYHDYGIYWVENGILKMKIPRDVVYFGVNEGFDLRPKKGEGEIVEVHGEFEGDNYCQYVIYLAGERYVIYENENLEGCY